MLAGTARLDNGGVAFSGGYCLNFTTNWWQNGNVREFMNFEK